MPQVIEQSLFLFFYVPGVEHPVFYFSFSLHRVCPVFGGWSKEELPLKKNATAAVFPKRKEKKSITRFKCRRLTVAIRRAAIILLQRAKGLFLQRETSKKRRSRQIFILFLKKEYSSLAQMVFFGGETAVRRRPLKGQTHPLSFSQLVISISHLFFRNQLQEEREAFALFRHIFNRK